MTSLSYIIKIVSKLNQLTSLSVFFPIYNEAENIPLLIERAQEIIPQIAKEYELILINDGSSDGSQLIIEDLARKNKNVRAIHHPKNLGYGEVLKTGIKESQYQWIFFTDADLQFDLGELSRFIPFVDKYKAIIGYRHKRVEGFGRAFNAELFKIYIDLLFRIHVRDIDCAFKLIDAELLKSLKLNSGSAFTSAEILYRLKKKRVKFKEIPVAHYPRLYGKATGANLKVIVKACYEALRTYLEIKFVKQ